MTNAGNHLSVSKVVEAFVSGNFDRGSNSGETIYFNGDVLYSYGHHFPLLVRKGKHYLFNVDSYSNTTGKHQSHASGAVPSWSRIPMSFRLLKKAGISYKDIEIMDNDGGTTLFKVYREMKRWYNEETGKYDLPTGTSVQYEWVKNPVPYYYLTGAVTDGVKDGYNDRYLVQLLNEKLDDNIVDEEFGGLTVEDAINSLKPEEVKEAEAEGREVIRKGEFFLVRNKQDNVGLKIKDFVKEGYVEIKKDQVIDGSNHFAKELVDFRSENGGKLFVKGYFKHVRRTRSMLRLDDWFEVYHNTSKESWTN